MTTNYPTSLDSLTNPAPTDEVDDVDHAGQHEDANDAIEALEAKVGVDGSAVTTSLDYQMENHAHTAGVDDGGAISHANLTGLTSGDPHTPYRLESADHSHQSTGTQAGQLDHGAALTGLTDDDHTQYLKEKASGGTAAEVPEHTHESTSEGGTIDTLVEEVVFSGIISPTALAANTDDWNPTDLATASTIRITSDAAYNVTGLQGGAAGRLLLLHNCSGFIITLKDEDANSSAANRFALTADIAMPDDGLVVLQYDGTDSRWRAVSGGGGGGSHDIISATHSDTSGSPSTGDFLVYDGADWVPESSTPPSGTFEATANQTVASAGTAYAVAFDSETDKEGLTHSTVTNNSRIEIDEAGHYLIIVSAVYDVQTTPNKHLDLWLRIDGTTDVTNSNTHVEIPSAAAEAVLAVAFLYSFVADQYFEIMYTADSTNVRLLATAAPGGGSPVPASPAVICTVSKVATVSGSGGGGTSLTVQEGDSNVATNVATLDFDSSDFNLTESPSGEVNIALNYGTGAGNPAEGNHTHAGSSTKQTALWSSKVRVAAGQSSDRLYFSEAVTIQYVFISLPSTNSGTVTVDVHKNGTTIFTTQANRPSISSGIKSTDATPDVTAVADGDYLEVHVDACSGTSGRLKCYIVYV